MATGVYPEQRSQAADSETRVMLAVLADRCPTYGTIIARTGLSRSVVSRCLGVLWDAGLVDWEPNKRGTIRPLVAVVALLSGTDG